MSRNPWKSIKSADFHNFRDAVCLFRDTELQSNCAAEQGKHKTAEQLPYLVGESHQTTQRDVVHILPTALRDVWSVVRDADYSTQTTLQAIMGILLWVVC